MTTKLPPGILFIFFMGALLFTGCAKDDLTPSDPKVVVDTTTETIDYVPIYNDRTGILISINEYNYVSQNGISVENISGKAKALFPDDNGMLRTAGNVAVQNVSLSVTSNNSYDFAPTENLPSGINFINSNDVRWTISGNAEIPSMSFICVEGFPTMSEIKTDVTEIDRTKDFNMATEFPIENADSVRFNIFAPNGYLFADANGSHSSHVFTSSKLTLLNPGTSYIRITAFRTVPIEYNGQTIQYINESVTTKKIVIK